MPSTRIRVASSLLAASVIGLVTTGQPAARQASERAAVIKVETEIERAGSDAVAPFERPQAGAIVFFRVTLTSKGPDTVRKGELAVTVITTSPVSTINGRNGWRCSGVFAGGAAVGFRCVNTIVLRHNGSLSILVRVPASGVRAGVAARIAKTATADRGLRLGSSSDSSSIKVVRGPGVWEGDWSWRATQRGTGRVFVAPSVVSIGHGLGTEVCATWRFSGGGEATGTATAETWTAKTKDGYGTGSWRLTLTDDADTFTGTQTVTPKGTTKAEIYDIVGERQTGAGTPPNCLAIRIDA